MTIIPFIQVVIGSLSPCPFITLESAMRHGQRMKEQGEELIQSDQHFEGSIAFLTARAVLRTLATTPTSRSHDERHNDVGRRDCLIHAPVAVAWEVVARVGPDRLFIT